MRAHPQIPGLVYCVRYENLSKPILLHPARSKSDRVGPPPPRAPARKLELTNPHPLQEPHLRLPSPDSLPSTYASKLGSVQKPAHPKRSPLQGTAAQTTLWGSRHSLGSVNPGTGSASYDSSTARRELQNRANVHTFLIGTGPGTSRSRVVGLPRPRPSEKPRDADAHSMRPADSSDVRGGRTQQRTLQASSSAQMNSGLQRLQGELREKGVRQARVPTSRPMKVLVPSCSPPPTLSRARGAGRRDCRVHMSRLSLTSVRRG
ncbi:hypothetical protein C8Q78DRAFT_1022418 [Trametes maxima]|nr:hypothetical protein C8Q78DRAFT_1022418 [Trametes maxima]